MGPVLWSGWVSDPGHLFSGALGCVSWICFFASDGCIYLYSVLCVKCLLFEDELSRPDRESLMSFGKQRGLIIILPCVSEFSCQLLSSAINTGFCLQHMRASCSFLPMFLSVLFMVRFFFFFFSHTSSYRLQPLFLQFHPVRWFPSPWASTTSP